GERTRAVLAEVVRVLGFGADALAVVGGRRRERVVPGLAFERDGLARFAVLHADVGVRGRVALLVVGVERVGRAAAGDLVMEALGDRAVGAADAGLVVLAVLVVAVELRLGLAVTVPVDGPRLVGLHLRVDRVLVVDLHGR